MSAMSTMSAKGDGPDSELNAAVIEIKEGSASSPTQSDPNMTQDEPEPDTGGGDNDSQESRRGSSSGRPEGRTKTEPSSIQRWPSSSRTSKASASRTDLSDSGLQLSSEGEMRAKAEKINRVSMAVMKSVLPRPECEIPGGLAKLLRDLPDPRDLAGLLRTVVASADSPFARAKSQIQFKSQIKIRRRETLSNLQVPYNKVQVGRRREDRPSAYTKPTYEMAPKEVPNWRYVRTIMKEMLVSGLTDVRYSSFLGENACRILAAAIVQRVKKLNYERYQLVAEVRIAQKLHQGLLMEVSCMWDSNVDRFAYVHFENPTLVAQVTVFLVYRE